MRTAPEDLGECDLVRSLHEGWGLEAVAVEHAPVGGGSYHWVVRTAAGERHWVTVDDLDRKEWLGATRESTFRALQAAFGTALALRGAGLEFVLPPVPAAGSETARRLGERHAVALFPFVEGDSLRFGERLAPPDQDALVDMLVRLHRLPASAAAGVRPATPGFSGRSGLEQALGALDREWAGGPFSEPARALVAGRATAIRRLVEVFDRLAEAVRASSLHPVITHGEPHPGNLVRSGGGLLLVDWDTVGLAPPERDLWMLDADGGDAAARYAEASGRRLDGVAIRLYRLRWLLDDIAIFLGVLRAPHRRTADTEWALRALTRSLESEAVGQAAHG